MNNKVAHVLAATQNREHECHWAGCRKQVKPAMWGCALHWKTLPQAIRNRIWGTYSPGQEKTLTPSAAYLAAAADAKAWITQYQKQHTAS